MMLLKMRWRSLVELGELLNLLVLGNLQLDSKRILTHIFPQILKKGMNFPKEKYQGS